MVYPLKFWFWLKLRIAKIKYTAKKFTNLEEKLFRELHLLLYSLAELCFEPVNVDAKITKNKCDHI
jgi:hypothetical protein